MNSFASKVKNEISSVKNENLEEAAAKLQGMLVFGGKFKDESFLVSYENKEVAEKLSSLISFALPLLKLKKETLKTAKKTLYLFKMDSNQKILKDLIYSKPQNLEAFISGAFLSCGSITNPQVDYHLEFHLSSVELCNTLMDALKNLEQIKLDPKIIKRRGSYFVYIKGNEKIKDFLVLIGANSCAMEFIQVKMIKEVRNNINRTTNFETANLSKITGSSSEHIKAIKKIIRHKKLESLPENLKEIAKLRLENPYVSLKELSNLCEKPVSKSGVNHRLKKLIEIAENF